MKRIITGCLLLNFAMAAQAECNISSSIQNIDYGKRSAAMRQVDRGKTTQLADIDWPPESPDNQYHLNK
ncbi:hypothetical protein C5P21_05140 [Escherichia coli]|uniref:hypothetical protein n=1 Tax=Escherichia coli TaxID=562 RepID=UPI000CF13F80|nr:hypothetical protein [Escherichia coli]EFN8710129.1 hypothetical protein [Escherichia coli O130]EGL9087348.1 hypothetical protein [Escherichia coli]MBM3034469.1 hypothetical protein [Escherichia coli]MDF9008818.1 hypothetical protein [Escherichia coli]MDU1705687.1 hypothetical protein [Escherichia coli]